MNYQKPITNYFQLQRAYCTALSIPRHRRKKFKHSSKWYSGVRKAALRGKCTSLIKILALPLDHRRKRPKSPVRYVQKSALNGKATSWNNVAALPKLKHVRVTKQHYFDKLGRRQQAATLRLMEQLLEKYKELHPPEGEHNETLVKGVTVHKKCIHDPQKECKSMYICELAKKERVEFLTRMIKLCQPKPLPKPPMPDRGPKKRIEELERLLTLAIPAMKIDLTIKDPFKVKPEALEAEASERILRLAEPRKEPPPAQVFDFRGNEILPPRAWDIQARRRVITSERTMELAIPKRTKKKAAEEEKENAFMVSKAALKAVCSDRLKKLAKPKVRD